MAESTPRNNAHCTIPDDPDPSTYRFIIVAAKRARQLQGGARPFLPTSTHEPTIIALEEVRRGLVKSEIRGQTPGEEPPPPGSSWQIPMRDQRHVRITADGAETPK